MYFIFPYSDSKFKRSDAFVGFQKDTPASVVFQASNMFISGEMADVLYLNNREDYGDAEDKSSRREPVCFNDHFCLRVTTLK